MNCEGIEISPASSDDLNDILALLSEVQLPHDGVAENVNAFLVARNKQSRLIGTIGLERHGNTALLRSAAIAPDCQKSGLGSRLTEDLLQRATTAGVERVVLLTTTAREFFARRFGFCETPRDLFEEQLAGSSEWNLPRCSSATCLSLDLNSRSGRMCQ
ncbi:MAG TPA: GNAT family N-acetyltransferase [Pyrinomonadaceae bacterium]|nr:GNAT family N-acetyltransferase [Pyrinomonadaceae bacterium]